MPFEAEKISEKESSRFSKLRQKGKKDLRACVETQLAGLPILDQVARLSESGQLDMFYEAIGKARLEGFSWLKISAAASGGTEYADGRQLHINYNSYCRNNNIDPVRTRRLKNP